jgi:CheY-like chemotaxis protein
MIPFSIYVVDDEQTVREGVSMALEADYEVEAYSAAEPAIDVLKDNPPDLVLLDIGLPGMDGIEALRKIENTNPDS